MIQYCHACKEYKPKKEFDGDVRWCRKCVTRSKMQLEEGRLKRDKHAQVSS